MSNVRKIGYRRLLRWMGGRPVQRALLQMQSYFSRPDDPEPRRIQQAYVSLLKRILETDGPLSAADLAAFRRLLSQNHSESEVEHLAGLLHEGAELSPAEAAAAFSGLPEADRRELLRSLVALAVETRALEPNRVWLDELAAALAVPAETLAAWVGELQNERLKREKIIRSGAGILVVLIVIAVFILTATLLKSVIFGLIGAYAVLPLEQFFERRLQSGRGVIHGLSRVLHGLGTPFRRVSQALLRYRDRSEPSAEERERIRQRGITAQAVSFATVTVLVVLLAIGIGLGALTTSYVGKWRASVTRWAQTEQAQSPELAEQGTFRQSIQRLRQYLEERRGELERVPLIRAGIDAVSQLLNDEAAQRELVTQALKRTGGVFAFTASVFGWFCQFLLNVLLTVFFFLFFLTKLAEFCRGNATPERQSEYLVRTVFNGAWLPVSGEATVREAQRILAEIILKLRIWIRGYLTLIGIDLVVYTGAYYLLDVPYFFVLGPIAACGVVLPILGPLFATSLTLLVTLAGGDASGLQLAGIVLVYLVENTLIEQFILYPVIFGGALGLTTLETIIVVLLGGIFAGIAGMLLAIPTAAILKYLVPQIYHCLDERRRTPGERRT